MESTYGFTQIHKAICWFAIVFFSIAAIMLLYAGFFLARRLLAGVPEGQLASLSAISCFAVFWALQCVRMLLESRRLLRFSVGISDDAIHVGDVTVNWGDVQSVAHPKMTFGLAFRLVTRSGRKLDVYSGIEGVRQIEELVKSRAAGHGPGNE